MAKKWMSEKPTSCDICHNPLGPTFVDGKTNRGPWGILCGTCFRYYGVGLGTGKGQMYDTETLEKVGG